jgi:20S proteasome alpha/beta subunit
MSLCIAATCKHEGVPCVVHCCDMAGTRGDVKSEDVIKIQNVGACTVLLAGNMSHARRLLTACSGAIESFPLGGDDLAITKLIRGLVAAGKEMKRELATEQLSSQFGLTYDEVFNFSPTRLDDPVFIDAWRVIRSVGLGAELIISAFSDDEVALLTMESDGKVIWTPHFAAVGTGNQICQAFLLQRDYFDHMNLGECLYRVLEAKIAAERNNHVGRKTNLEVRLPRKNYDVGASYVDRTRKEIEQRRALPMLEIPTELEEFGTGTITAGIEKAHALSSGQ